MLAASVRSAAHAMHGCLDVLCLMFAVPVDAKQGDRATAMHWRSFKRPHMRIFYVSTFSYFTAFLAWFAFAPLLPEVSMHHATESFFELYN
jgi:predicted MFS family arabinose efflux permease